MKEQKGFSLIELLCGIVIGLICITVITELFVEYKKTSRLEIALAEIQENAIFAAHILRENIESAGLIGCRKLSDNLPVTNRGVSLINQLTFNHDIKVFFEEDNQRLPSLPIYLKISPKKNTDVILVRYMASMTGWLLETLGDSNSIFVSLNPKFKKNTDVVIADCKHVVLAHLKKASRYPSRRYQRLITTEKIIESFNAHAEVGQLKTSVFFVGKTTRKNPFGKVIYALYEMNERGRKSELISNIISLKVSCLLNKNGMLKYEPSKSIDSWTNVYALQIKLMLVSGKNMHKTFQFLIPLREHIYRN